MTTAKPTLYAQRGLEFVAIFQVKLINFHVSGHRPLLRDPPGESTAGGKLATQHIVLQPSDPSAPVLTVGSVNVATQTAKLRSHDCMWQLHKTRFGNRPFLLDAEQYQRFIEATVTLMREREIQVEIEDALPEVGGVPAALSGSPNAVTSRGSGGVLWILFIVVLLATTLIAFFFLRGVRS